MYLYHTQLTLSLLMCAHEDDAIMHYVTECIIASLKDLMSAG